MAQTYRQKWAQHLKKQYTKDELVWKYIERVEWLENALAKLQGEEK